MSENRTLVSAFISVAGSKAVILASSAALTPAIIQFAGKQTYGEFATLMSAFALASIFMSDGIHSGVRKYISEERPVHEWQNKVFGYYFRLALVLSILMSVAFAVVATSGIVTRIWSEQYVTYFYLLIPLALVAQFRGYLRQALMGLKLEHISEPSRALYKFVYAVTAIGFAVFGFGIPGLVGAHIVGSVLTIIVLLWFLRDYLSLRSVFSLPSRNFPRWELFNFNYRSVVYTFFLMSMIHVDVLMLEAFTDTEQVAYYKAALVITQFLWFVPRTMQSLMIQSTSNLWANGRIGQITELSSRVTRYVLLLSILLAVGMGALATDFVTLYLGEGMLPSVTPLLILLPGTVGFAIARPILSISHAKGDLAVLIATTGVAAVLNFGLNAALIPMYGMQGAAIATTTGYASLALLQFVGARYLGYRPFSDLRPLRIASVAILSAGPILLLARTITNPFVALLVVPVAGFLLYAGLTVAFGAVTIREVLDVLASAPGVVGSKAASLHGRLENRGLVGTIRASRALQVTLVLVGVALLVTGGAVTALQMSGSNVFLPGADDDDETATPTATPEATSTSTATSTGTQTPVPTEAATPTETESDSLFGDTETETETPIPTQTESPSDDDILFDDDDETATATETPTETATPTETETETETATPTETETATPTPTPTPTETETETSNTTDDSGSGGPPGSDN